MILQRNLKIMKNSIDNNIYKLSFIQKITINDNQQNAFRDVLVVAFEKA